MAAFGVPAAGAVCRCASLCLAVPRCGSLWAAVPRGPRGAIWRTNLFYLICLLHLATPSHTNSVQATMWVAVPRPCLGQRFVPRPLPRLASACLGLPCPASACLGFASPCIERWLRNVLQKGPALGIALP